MCPSLSAKTGEPPSLLTAPEFLGRLSQPACCLLVSTEAGHGVTVLLRLMLLHGWHLCLIIILHTDTVDCTLLCA